MRAVLLAVAILAATSSAAMAQSTSKARPINPLKPPGQADTPSGFHLLQPPSNEVHNPAFDPARKRRGKLVPDKNWDGKIRRDTNPYGGPVPGYGDGKL
jgi:hypothetical protein